MATTGSVDVNLTSYGNMVNNASNLGAEVTGGIADQGALIGLAFGLVIALGALFVVVYLVFDKFMGVANKAKKIK